VSFGFIIKIANVVLQTVTLVALDYGVMGDNNMSLKKAVLFAPVLSLSQKKPRTVRVEFPLPPMLV